MAERTVRFCDRCLQSDLEVAAADRAHIRFAESNRRVKMDLCRPHIEELLGSPNGKYVCEVCGKDMTNPQGLGKHRADTGHGAKKRQGKKMTEKRGIRKKKPTPT